MAYTRDQINHILYTNPKAVERAIIQLFRLQTSSEQRTANSKNHNDVGFNTCDAKAGTRFARWLLGMNDANQAVYKPKSLQLSNLGYRDARNLKGLFTKYCKDHRGDKTPMDRARRIALTHSKQLVRIANGEIEVPK